MLQRMTLIFVALLCCLSIVMTFMVWQSIENSQTAMAALVAQVQKLAESTEAQAKPEDESLKYLDWVPVTVKLEYEDGTPVTDEKVHATFGTARWVQNVAQRTVSKRPDETGTLSFGYFTPGQMELRISMPWDESFSKGVNVEPGFPIELTVACPRKKLEEIPADLEVEWPADIREQNLWTAFEFAPVKQHIGNNWWERTPRIFLEEYLNQEMLALIDPQGKIYLINLKTRHDETVRTGYSIDLLETYLSGQFDEGAPLGFMYERPVYASADAGEFRSSSYPKLNIRDTLEEDVHGVLSPQVDQLNLPECGVNYRQVYVLKLVARDDNSVTFQQVLPVGFDTRVTRIREEAVIKPDDWTYHPSDKIVELVRQRLEQIDAEQKPAEENNTEAAEVSAGVD